MSEREARDSGFLRSSWHRCLGMWDKRCLADAAPVSAAPPCQVEKCASSARFPPRLSPHEFCPPHPLPRLRLPRIRCVSPSLTPWFPADTPTAPRAGQTDTQVAIWERLGRSLSVSHSVRTLPASVPSTRSSLLPHSSPAALWRSSDSMHRHNPSTETETPTSGTTRLYIRPQPSSSVFTLHPIRYFKSTSIGRPVQPSSI